jgi:prepilin-type N-terminal cleavage/methylation domain-containing protein
VVARRGFTIVEVIICSVMMLVLLLGVYAMLTNGTRYARQTEAYAYAQREGVLVARALTNEVSNSVKNSAYTGSGWFEFLSGEPPDGSGLAFDPISGKIIWRKWVGYYYRASDRTLVRAEIPLTTPTSVAAPLPEPPGSPPTDFINAAIQRVVGHSLDSFTAAVSSQGYWDFTIVTSYQAAVPGSQDQTKTARVTLVSRVHILNTYP